MNKFEALEFRKENARIKARSKLISFIQYVKDDYDATWFHKIIAGKCEDILHGRSKKVMIFVPPQHGKSEIVSRKFPAYALGVNPNLKIASCSYSSDLSEGFSREIQRTIDSNNYHELFPNTFLNDSNVRTNAKGGYVRTVEKFEIVNHVGFFKAVGVGGSLTGNPIDIGIIDDPIKDSIEANSLTYRERIWDWYVNVFKTRMHNDSREILMMTRWHEDDLAGRILKLEPFEWEVIIFEGIHETPMGYDTRKIGEALWPAKHSKQRLLDIFKISPQTFAALIQQNPKEAMTGNELLKAFSVETHVEENLSFVPEESIHISMDSNVYPYIAITVWQMTKIDNNWNVKQIAELPAADPENTAARSGKKIARYLNSIYYTDTVFLYGDTSTKSRNNIDEEKRSFFQIVQQTLRNEGFRTQDKMGVTSPPVASIIDFVNAILNNEIQTIKIQISKECFLSIKDYKETKVDKDGSMLKKRVKNKEGITYEPNGHLTDTFKDFIYQAFTYEFENYKRGNRVLEYYSGNTVTRHR